MTDDSLERALGRIEGKLDSVLGQISTHEILDEKRFTDIGSRLGGLEKWQSKVIGMSLALGAIGGIIVRWFTK